MIRLSQVRVWGPHTFWVEERPHEKGRNVLLWRRGDGQVSEVLPPTPSGELVDVRTRVHEYGGKAYALEKDLIVVSNVGDGCLYALHTDRPLPDLVRLTPQVEDRYGDMEIDLERGLVYAVRERHDGTGHVQNALVSIPLDGSAAREESGIKILSDNTDFVASPVLSHSARFLAFVTWSHPYMPWQQANLVVIELDRDGAEVARKQVIKQRYVAAQQPRWTFTDDLIHIDDSSGWGNLYRTEGFDKPDWQNSLRTRDLHPTTKAFSAPGWQLGLHSYDILDSDHLVAAWAQTGTWHLGTLRLDNGQLEEWPSGWAPSGNVASARGRTVMLADNPLAFESVVEIIDGQVKVLRSSAEVQISQDSISVAEPLSWDTTDGTRAHGFFYPPRSSTCSGIDGELPPLIVMPHSGPTEAARTGLRSLHQYWTTRGFAVLEVNYRGSTSYGRAYRDALNGRWGIADVDDCRTGAEYLVGQGVVDPQRVAIRGRSAGGYTALQALTSTGIFTAGTSICGICDLQMLARHTHKFESHYMFGLVGARNEDDPVLRERSPLHHAGNISAPLLLIQGADDPVVPAQQAHAMKDALAQRGIDVELLIFEGEGHHFRNPQAQQRALLAELDFYRRVWGITR